MRNTGTLHLKLVALGVAAALGSSTLLAQERDPSPIERDRASVSESQSQADRERDALDTDRQAQSRDSQTSPSQQRAGQSPGAQPGIGSDSQRQAGQQPGQQPGQQSSQQPGQQPGQAADRDLQASQSSSSGSQAFDSISEQHDDLGTFVELIKAAGLEDSLTDGTNYTVFAPTDEAFEQELESMGKTKEELLSPEGREDLVAMLRAHIVADDVDQEMARNLSEARTIDGGSVGLSSEGEELMVGDASVVDSDIQEGSLRVYAIDQVLEANAPAQAASASEPQGEQPAAAVQAPRGEQPSASARDLGENQDQPEPRLN